MGQATEASKSILTMEPIRPDISGSNPWASALSEKALVRNAVCALSHGVFTKLPPSASWGANAMACRNPSTPPHRASSSEATAAI